MDKNELLFHNHTNIQELIRFIDQKAAALLVVYGFIFTATVEFSKDLKFVNPFTFKSGWETFQSSILLAIGLLLLILLIYQVYFVLFRIIRPRAANNYNQEEASVLYFDHISKKEKQVFVTSYVNLSEADLQKEMLEQIYEISCILSRKSEKFNWVLKFLFATIIVLLLFIYFSKSI